MLTLDEAVRLTPDALELAVYEVEGLMEVTNVAEGVTEANDAEEVADIEKEAALDWLGDIGVRVTLTLAVAVAGVVADMLTVEDAEVPDKLELGVGAGVALIVGDGDTEVWDPEGVTA